MNALGYRPDIKITDMIGQGRFTLSAEVIPPRNGTEQFKVLEQIQALVGSGAEFLSVTKGAGGSLRGGSLPIAQAIKERFKVPCIAHFTCRDITPQEVENQLMDHHYFGIRNILALRGDPPNGMPDWKPREGAHLYAHELIRQIRELNEGKYIPRPGGHDHETEERTDFCIGAAVYPEHPNEKERIEFFKKKIDEGAEYAITQMVFDVDAYEHFLNLCQKNGISVPILPGVRMLRTQKQARTMAEQFCVSVPERMIRELPEEATAETLDQVHDQFHAYIESLKRVGAPGIHLFVLNGTKWACRTLTEVKIR